jgi:hypothetical protein
MAKMKPKKRVNANPKTKAAKPKPKPKAHARVKAAVTVKAVAPPPTPPAVGKPLVTTSFDGTRGSVTGIAIEVDASNPFGTDCAPTAAVDQATSSSWGILSFGFNTARTIMRITLEANSSSSGVGDSGTLQISLDNPPGPVTSPVNVPVDYIDDLPEQELLITGTVVVLETQE